MMTVGELIDTLQRAKPDDVVQFDFGGLSPTIVDSWRGIYAEAALGFDGGTHGATGSVTAAQLIARLNKAIAPGAEYMGWKGGDYHYNRDTRLHIDNPGCCTNTELTRVEILDYGYVILHTEHAE